jgi:serine/threonine protein kinase
MGEVYEAADLELHQHVALKLIRFELRNDPKYISLLKEEVRQARSISHPNVCRVFTLERDEVSQDVFLTMALLRGETLEKRLRRGPVDLQEARRILRQIADGMDAIHAHPMLHLDLKPANVMLDSSPGGRTDQASRAIVNDFGLARSLAPLDPLETTRSILEVNGGTPLYMPPERFIPGAPVTRAADVYAFGLIAFELLAGPGSRWQPGRPPPPLRSILPDMPPEWEAMVKGCLAPAPGDRFPDCGTAMKSLDAPAPPVETTAPPVSRTASLPRLRKHWLSLASIAGAVVLASAAFFFWPARPLASAAALKWYRQGVDALREGTYYKATGLLGQSLKESPGYPLAHASLAEAWLELDSPDRASEEMLRASAPGNSSDRLETRDRERLEAVHSTLTRDFPHAVAVYTRLAESAPATDRPGALVDLGRALERATEPRKALDEYQKAVSLDHNYAGAWLRLAMVEGQLQQAAKMADALQHAESLYEAASDLEGETEVCYQRGTFASRQSRLNDAGEWLERARKSAVATRNPHQQIRALYQLSAVAYQKGDTVTAETLGKQAIEEAHAANIEFLAGRTYLDLGNAMRTRGDYAKATEYFNDLLRFARNYHNGRLEATALYSLGGIANRQHPDAEGTRQIEQALAWFQANGYPSEASYCLVLLGRIRRDSGDLAGAGQAFNKQLELARASHDDLQTVVALASVSSILFLQERFPEALELAAEQLTISNRMGDTLRAAYAQDMLAQLYAELGRFEESGAAAEAVESAARKSNIEGLLVSVAVTRTRTRLLAGSASEAANLADRGIRAYEAKYPEEAGEFLGIMARARAGVSFNTRWAWCEKGIKLAQGASDTELALRLTEVELLLETGKAQRVLDLYPDLHAAFERRQGGYSLFRTELAAALANRQLGRKDADGNARVTAALESFKKRFSDADWVRFSKRADFQIYDKNMLRFRS